MMGQAGLCLAGLLRGESPALSKPRLIHVHHATFVAPVLPGTTVDVLAEVLDEGFTLLAAGQIFHDATLCAYAVSEVYVGD
jgi:hypothetical protein